MEVIYNLANNLFLKKSFGDTALYKQSRKRDYSSYRGRMFDVF